MSFFFCCHIYDSVVCHVRPSLPANSSSFCRPATGSEMSQLLLTCRQKNRRSIFQIHSDYWSLNTRAGLWLVVSEIGQTLVSSVSCSEAEDAFKYLWKQHCSTEATSLLCRCSGHTAYPLFLSMCTAQNPNLTASGCNLTQLLCHICKTVKY